LHLDHEHLVDDDELSKKSKESLAEKNEANIAVAAKEDLLSTG